MKQAVAFLRLGMRPEDPEAARSQKAELAFRFVWLEGTWRAVDGRFQTRAGDSRRSESVFEWLPGGTLQVNDALYLAPAVLASWRSAAEER